MMVNISSNLIKAMLDWVELQLGLKISESRHADFEKSLCLAANDAGCRSPADFISKFIRGNPSQAEIGTLSSYLTVGETYFFRDPLSFSVLVDKVLPELERQKENKQLRIWSAGCSTGEEPYSIAISLVSQLGQMNQNINPWNIEILASDINPQSLDIARKGNYRRWSFRDVPSFIQSRFFNLNADHKYRIDGLVKDLVHFFYLNLAQPDSDFPDEANGTTNLDIIFCRNVLIYFSPEQTAEVLYKFYKALNPGGWLFLGPTEIPHPTPSFFSIVNFDGALVLQAKESFGHSWASAGSIHPVSISHSNYSFFGTKSVDSKAFDNLVQPDENAFTSSATNWRALSVPASSLDESPNSLFNRGEYKRVIDRLFEASNSQSKKTTDEMALIAKSYANLGNLEAACDWCEQLISLDIVNPRWYYLKATIEQEKTSDKNAIQALRQAIFLDPDFIMAHMALGNILKQHGQKDDSRRYYQNASDLLSTRDGDEIVPDSDGLTAGQLLNIVRSLSPQGECI